jgi:crotonobetainyl-CoA:carnitine CoA-transferase CaiB-like acyl-CoA transferase
MLADMGAEVIKIEKPGTGDESRSHGPFPNDIPDPEKSGLFLFLNTNKRDITLNLETKTGMNVFKKLIEEVDIFVENNPPETIKCLGIDYAELHKINPKLIMASITPFGQTGPYKDYKAYDINSCASGGMSVGVGDPDREPLTMPLSQGSYQAGVSAAIGILGALFARKKNGEGQHIDVSEAEVWATLHMIQSSQTFLYRGVTGIRRGIHAGFFLYPGTILPCKDGFINLSAPQLEQWIRFLKLMGNPSWAENPRYRNRRAMHEEYPDETDALLKPWFKEHTKEEIFQLCQQNRIPFSPIYNIEDLINHPHLRDREFFVEVNHPRAGKLQYPLGPCRFSKTNWTYERAAPLLGQDNEEILCKRLGYSREALSNLRRSGII